jgi:carboxymethylenebutenolidase
MSVNTGILESTVSFPGSGTVPLSAYLVLPQGEGPFPGIVVIHEAYGLNDNIRDVCKRFANEGYVALGVDLFGEQNRIVCMARLIGGLLLNSLDHRGIRDLKKALDYLTVQPHVDATRIGAVGYCMGGGLAIAWACTDKRLKAIAPYYAANPRPLEAVSRLCPVVGSYPDPDITTGAGRKLDEVLDKYDIPHDIKIYQGAAHSFFNNRGKNYNADAAQDSWQRVLSFFRTHIAHG